MAFLVNGCFVFMLILCILNIYTKVSIVKKNFSAKQKSREESRLFILIFATNQAQKEAVVPQESFSFQVLCLYEKGFFQNDM